MKKFLFSVITFTVILCLTTMQAKSQNAQISYDLLLKTGPVNMVENLPDYVENFDPVKQVAFKDRYYKIVQFYNIPTQQQMLSMTEKGMVFLDYIPNKSYIVSFSSNFNVGQLLFYNIRSIGDILPQYKQSPALLDKQYPQWALRGQDEIAVVVNYHASLRLDDVQDYISSVASSVIQNDDFARSQIIVVPFAKLETLVEFPFVSFVEPIYPPAEPENFTGKTLHRSNVLDSDFEGGRHYDGTGVKVMLQDDGIIGPHVDYEGRIGNQYITSNSGDHGDHCAGIIFGAGNIDPTATGQAPGAELFTYGAAPEYPGFNLIPGHYSNPGIRISSTSYSNGCNAGYTSLARTMDSQIRNYPALMHVFSAGNEGTSNCGYGAGAGWGNVTGGHKIAKNVTTVANLDYKDALSSSSSRGPAHDGRIKPDISAKGSDVYSTVDPNTYAFKSGTSMSCPGVSGSLAQLYHAYRELNGGNDPKGGLIKGLVLNTAEDLGNSGPDFKFGWGRINNFKAVKALEENRFFTGEISQGETNDHTFFIPAGTLEVRVMVYWTDKEANIGTSKALVNDINIIINDPSNQTYFPWLLNPYPHPDSLNKPAVKGIDFLNNMEQVSIENPISGNCTLEVEGFEIPFGPQEYFVFYEFLTEEITVTYPLGGESFDLNQQITVRWDAEGSEQPFTVEFSTDGGQNWIIINNNVSGGLRYLIWNVPDEMTGSGLVRVSRNGFSDTSDEVFSVMGIPEDFVYERACPESVLIRWEQVPGAISYDVYQLGEKYMEVIGSTTADSLWVEGISFSDEYWFSVRAIGPGNATGQRVLAELKTPGVWNCIFSKDLSVSDVISPPVGVLFDCQNLTNINVKIEITNEGLQPMQNINVFYQFENGAVMEEAYGEEILPGQAVIFTFNSTVSLPSAGNYDIKVWIESAEDENAANNMIEATCNLKTAQYLENNEIVNFDEFSSCSYSPDCEDIACYINNQWYNLGNITTDDIDWRLLNGITPTPYTGPTGDHTLGTLQGRFLYLEPSGECYNKKAVLHSPCIDLSGMSNPGVIFWYHMFGEDMGTLHVDVVSNGSLFKDIMVPVSGDQGDQWNEAYVYLADFTGENICLRFRGYTGDGEYSDMAIDDILITEITGLTNLQGDDQVRVFPNPSDGVYQISFNPDAGYPRSISVNDLTGRTIYNTIPDDIDRKIQTLDISQFKAGMYYLVIEFDHKTINQKILKF